MDDSDALQTIKRVLIFIAAMLALLVYELVIMPMEREEQAREQMKRQYHQKKTSWRHLLDE